MSTDIFCEFTIIQTKKYLVPIEEIITHFLKASKKRKCFIQLSWQRLGLQTLFINSMLSNNLHEKILHRREIRISSQHSSSLMSVITISDYEARGRFPPVSNHPPPGTAPVFARIACVWRVKVSRACQKESPRYLLRQQPSRETRPVLKALHGIWIHA